MTTGAASHLTDFADAVLSVVEQIPTGSVMTYGDIAEYLGRGGPRQVGAVMAAHGGVVPWWRVVRADGSWPARFGEQALRQYIAEGTVLRSGNRVDLRAARWDGTSP
jgi:alkylated DNA nucleotide flippase Atl1